MTNTTKIIPQNLTDPSLRLMPDGTLTRLWDAVELGASQHWLFGGGSESLTDLIAGTTMVPQGVAPGYGDSYVEVDLDDANWLDTGISDTNDIEDTWCVVFRPTSFDNSSLLANGSNKIIAFNSVYDGIFSGISEIGINPTEWYFAAASRRTDQGDNPQSRTMCACGPGGAGSINTSVDTPGTYTANAGNFALGSKDNYKIGQFDVAEVIRFSSFLDREEILEVCRRSKARLDKRGITMATTVGVLPLSVTPGDAS